MKNRNIVTALPAGRLLTHLLPWRRQLSAGLALSLAENLLSLACPVLLGQIMDHMTRKGGPDIHTLTEKGLLLLLLYLTSSLCSYLLARIMILVSREFTGKLQREAVSHVLRMPMNILEQKSQGEIASILTYDMNQLYTMLSSDFVSILSGGLTVAGSFIMMARISWPLTGIFAVSVPLNALVTWQLTARSRVHFRERSGHMGQYTTMAGDAIESWKTVRLYGVQDGVRENLDRQSGKVRDAFRAASNLALQSPPLINCVNNAAFAVMGALGVAMHIRGGISLGGISAFILYSRRFAGLINEMVNQVSELQTSLASADKIWAILDTPVEEEDRTDRPAAVQAESGGAGWMSAAEWPSAGQIEITDLSFSWPDGSTVFRGLSMEIAARKMTAVAGITGEGKTTLWKLLLRYYDWQKGNILLDSRDIRAISRPLLRSCYTVVPQDPWVFTGTIAENIAYGNPAASMAEIEEVSRRAGLHELVMALPDAYQSVLGEGNRHISPGMLQLLSIARALLTDARIVILDEATAHLDAATERKIGDAIRELLRNRTGIVIAHHMHTILQADRICVLDHGCVAEEGTHEELLRQGGLYRQLLGYRK